MQLEKSLEVLADVIGAISPVVPGLPVETAPNTQGRRYIRLDGIGMVNDLLYKNRDSGTHRFFVHVIDKDAASLEWTIATMAQIAAALKEATIAGSARALHSESAEALFEPQTDESYDGHGIIRYRIQLGA